MTNDRYILTNLEKMSYKLVKLAMLLHMHIHAGNYAATSTPGND